MRTLPRHAVLELGAVLGRVPLGHLSDDTLDKVLANLHAFHRVEADLQHLNNELSSRLYSGVDPERKKACFDILAQADELRMTLREAKNDEEARKKVADIADLHRRTRENYADVWEMYQKHQRTYGRLLDREVEVDLQPLDPDEIVRALAKGEKNMPAAEVLWALEPLREADGNGADPDLSELDELLKQ